MTAKLLNASHLEDLSISDGIKLATRLSTALGVSRFSQCSSITRQYQFDFIT